MIINIEEEKGKQGLNGLIKITKLKQEKKKNTIIKELEELGVFD